MNVAPRMSRLGTESAFEVLARARQLERAGREIVHLEIGEPDFDTPAHIKEAAKQALDAGATHYGPAGGLPERPAAVAVARKIPVLAGEISRQFLYEGEFASIMNRPGMRDLTILLDGFSKSYAMTGWRLGYGVMPPPLAEHVARLMVNSNSCTASFSQLAGIAALEGDQTPTKRMVAEFKRRRDLVVEGLNRLPGVSCRSPRGAFYVFPNIQKLGRKSAEVADRLLRAAGVAVLPGPAFGEHGEGYLRLSYATSEANLRKALDRMAPVLARLGS